jgi:citrate synthase
MSKSQIVGEAEFRINGIITKLPVHKGSEDEKGIDITKLRSETSCVTLDPGFGNTGSCISAVTFIDGEKGILRYRGIPIEDLTTGEANFIETAYLLIYGKLPTQSEFDEFSGKIQKELALPENMVKLFDGFAQDAHPMAVLLSAVSSLSTYYPESIQGGPETFDKNIIRLIAKVITIAAYSYRKSQNLPYIEPDPKIGYSENFLHMMFAEKGKPYQADPVIAKALRMMFILHADHEQNCSTSTVRMVGSSQANIYASISAGIGALWGAWHGGANQAVIEMLEQIQREKLDVSKFVEEVKDKKSNRRLMGFGHRVYKNFDPRAKIIKKACDDVLKNLGINDPSLEIAARLEEAALSDEYFIQRKLYPNVDFYSGIILRAIGIPINMFTVIFAIGRLPGWIAHWKEMLETPGLRIYRPRQIYTGEPKRPYTPMDQRR